MVVPVPKFKTHSFESQPGSPAFEQPTGNDKNAFATLIDDLLLARKWAPDPRIIDSLITDLQSTLKYAI